MADLTARLLDEKASLAVYDETQIAPATMSMTNRKGVSSNNMKREGRGKDMSKNFCFNCRKKGHYTSKCPEPKKKREVCDRRATNSEENATAFNVTEQKTISCWMDYGQ